MLINLKTYAANRELQTVTLELQERLPARIVSPCLVNCQCNIKICDNYYLMTLNVDAMLTVICQRCLDEFPHHYVNQTILAACHTDDMAEKMMERYECIVASNNQVDLTELLTDELHLYAPEFHRSIENCNNYAAKFISK